MRRGLEIRNTSAAVVLLQIVGDGLGVGVADRRAESLDHLGDLGIPHNRTWERRVHLNVVEAVARGAVLLDHVEAGSFFEINRLLFGAEWRCKDCGEECEANVAYDVLAHATLSITL